MDKWLSQWRFIHEWHEQRGQLVQRLGPARNEWEHGDCHRLRDRLQVGSWNYGGIEFGLGKFRNCSGGLGPGLGLPVSGAGSGSLSTGTGFDGGGASRIGRGVLPQKWWAEP